MTYKGEGIRGLRTPYEDTDKLRKLWYALNCHI
jgi:hypothetical protein